MRADNILSYDGPWIKMVSQFWCLWMKIVASYMDAWIKISFIISTVAYDFVASSADAWIKMDPSDFRIGQEKKSHPLWCVD